MSEANGHGFDRQDGLRRRIYLICLVIGIPVLTTTWFVHRHDDVAVAVTYLPYIAVHTAVAVGLWRRSMSVRTAERTELVVNAIVFLATLAVALLGAEGAAQARVELASVTILTLNLLVMLSYLAFETREALRVSLGIVSIFLLIVGARLAVDVMAGQLAGAAIDYFRNAMFLVASVGLLHVLAQVKEQAAEARTTAAAMTIIAHTDALTGVANRRHLHRVVEDSVQDNDEDGRELALILLDIDHFKRINDAHGHDIGDDVLCQVAETLTSSIRDSDLCGRWGGEEFLVVASDTSPNEVAALAERCRANIAEAVFPFVGQVTASLGVATHHPGETAWPLLRRADDALYLAKAAGRNQVQFDQAHPDAQGPADDIATVRHVRREHAAAYMGLVEDPVRSGTAQ